VFASQVRLTAIALLPAGLIALYYLDAFHRDPLWSRTGMAYVNRPDPMVLCFAYGPLVLAAWAGCRTLAAMRRAGGDAAPSAKVWFPLTWSLTNGVALLFPIWQQGRQALGLSVPLALLAFLWLAGPRAASGIRPALHTLPAALLVMSAPFLLAIYTAVTASGIDQGYYLPNGVPEAVEWLGAHGTASDVVLADPVFGNLVPIQCSCHVVVGQYFETIDFARRQAEVLHFYQAPSNAAALVFLRAIVRREHATLVVYSPLERALPSDRELRHLPGFALVYDRQDVTIFRLATHA
jgi:hypothetical protein